MIRKSFKMKFATHAPAVSTLPPSLGAFLKLAGMAAMIAGGLRVVAAFINWQPNSLPHEGLAFVIDIGLMLGLAALFLVIHDRIGRLGIAGLAVAFLGIASILGPDTVAFGIDTYYFGATIVSIGLFILGIAGLRTRITPWWAYTAWVVSPILAIVGELANLPELGFVAAGIATGVGFVGVGYFIPRGGSLMPDLISGIDHVYLSVSDFNQSELFYDQVMETLGLFKGDKPIGGERHAHYIAANFQLTIRPAHSLGTFDAYRPGIHHLCLQAVSSKAVDECHQRLMNLGVEATTPRTYPEYSEGYYATFFKDPDGIRMEIVTRTEYRTQLAANWSRFDTFLNPLSAINRNQRSD